MSAGHLFDPSHRCHLVQADNHPEEATAEAVRFADHKDGTQNWL